MPQYVSAFLSMARAVSLWAPLPNGSKERVDDAIRKYMCTNVFIMRLTALEAIRYRGY